MVDVGKVVEVMGNGTLIFPDFRLYLEHFVLLRMQFLQFCPSIFFMFIFDYCAIHMPFLIFFMISRLNRLSLLIKQTSIIGSCPT